MIKALVNETAKKIGVELYRAGELELARAAFDMARRTGGVAPAIAAHADHLGVAHVAASPAAARKAALDADRTY